MKLPQFRLGVLFGLSYAAAAITVFVLWLVPRWGVVERMWTFFCYGVVK